jgi:hypothetical protein
MQKRPTVKICFAEIVIEIFLGHSIIQFILVLKWATDGASAFSSPDYRIQEMTPTKHPGEGILRN